MGLTDSDVCDYCEQQDTLLRTFVYCKICMTFWESFESMWKSCGTQIQTTDHTRHACQGGTPSCRSDVDPPVSAWCRRGSTSPCTCAPRLPALTRSVPHRYAAAEPRRRNSAQLNTDGHARTKPTGALSTGPSCIAAALAKLHEYPRACMQSHACKQI